MSVSAGRRTAVLVSLAAAAVTVVGAWHVSLWKDETDSISAATRSTSGIFRLVGHIDAVHGLYYLILHGWVAVFGRTALAVRFPSVVAVAAAAGGVYLLTRRLYGRQPALIAAGVFVALPRVTWMGIEARPFALSATAGVWLTYTFVLAVERGGARRWGGYALLAALSVALNIYLALAIAAHGLTLVVRRDLPVLTRSWLPAAAGALLLSAPVVVTAAGQRGQLGDLAIGAGKMARSIVVNQWFLGATPSHSSGPGRAWPVAAVILALSSWALVLYAVVRGVRDPRPRAAIELLLPWVVLPTVLVAAYSLTIGQLYSARYFCFCAPAVAILIAAGIASLRRHAVRWTAILVIVGACLPVYLSQRQIESKDSDWSQVAAYVSAHKQSGQGVYFVPRYPPVSGTVMSTARYMAVAYPDSFAGLRDITLAKTPAADDSLTGTSRLLTDSGGRLRTVSQLWVVRRNDYPSALVRADEAVLVRNGFHPVRTRTFAFDVVTLYQRS